MSPNVLGQAGAPDPGFQVQTLAPEQLCLQSDGKILATTQVVISTVTASTPTIERLNADGSVDSAFIGSDENMAPFPSQLTASHGYIYLISYLYINGSGPFGSTLQRYQESTGDLDTTFAGVTVPGQSVTGYTVEPNGQVLVWGDQIYRRNADGSLDTTFTPDPTLSVSGMSVTGNGKIYVWGSFLTVNGATRNGVARLNANGTLDTTFVPATNTNSYSFDMLQEPSGSVLVSLWDPVSARHTLVRLKSDGTADPSFQSPTFYFNTYTYYSYTETPNQKILVWSSYLIQADQTSLTDFVQLNADGTVDTTFTANDTDAGFVGSVLIQPDGKYVLAGEFGILGVPLVRLNVDGTPDASFNMLPGNTVGSLGSYQSQFPILQPDGKILTGLIPPYSGGGDVGGGVTIIVGPQPTPPAPPPELIARYEAYGTFVPQPVPNLTVDAVTPQLTRLSWGATPDVTGYEVERQESGQWVTKATVAANVTIYNDTAVDGVTNYSYRIVAKNGVGEALPSYAMSAAQPVAVASLTATPSNPTEVRLAWTPSVDAWQYQILRLDPGGASFTPVATLPAGASSYVDTHVVPLAGYNYEVIASNMVGQGVSDVDVVTLDNVAPVTPTQFAAGAVAANAISLVWQASTGATSYLIERSANGADGWQTVTTLTDGTSTNYVDTTVLTGGRLYYYRITAIDSVGSSLASTVVSTLAPDANWLPPGTLDPSFAAIGFGGVDTIEGVNVVPSGTISYLNYSNQYGTSTLQAATPGGAPITNLSLSLTGVFLPLADGDIFTTYFYYNLSARAYVYGLVGYTSTGAPGVTLPTITGGNANQLTQLFNGDVLVTGNFTAVNGQLSQGIAEVKPDGTLEPGFTMVGRTTNTGNYDGPVRQQSNGDILLVGYESLIRLLPNGQQDSSFGGSGQVKFDTFNLGTLAIQPDDKILVGGGFSTVDDGSGPARHSLLVRLTADGMVDSTFDTGIGFQIGGNIPEVDLIVVDPAGRIIVGGYSLGAYNGIPVGSMLRLFSDGSLDPSFQLPANFDFRNFHLNSDGKTFYAGSTLLQRYFYNPTTSAPPVHFANWGPGNLGSAPIASPRNDGVPNLMKYLFDINPAAPMGAHERAALPAVGMTVCNGAPSLTLTYRENAAMTGINVVAETSPDLKTWSTVPATNFVQVGNDPTTGDPVMQAQAPMTSSTQFIRLNVSQ